MSRIDEALAVPILFALSSGCQMRPEGERDFTGILEVRIRGISPEVAAVEVSAGLYTERVMLSEPTASLDLTLRGLPSGRTTVEARGMRGAAVLQMMQIDAVVREGLRSVLSVDLGSGTVDRVPDPGMDGGAAPGPVDAGVKAIESDPIVVSFAGTVDFSFPAPGVLRGRTKGDPRGAYRTFLERAAPVLREASSPVIGVSFLQMRLRQEEDDIALDDIYTALQVRLEGPLTGTSTLADLPNVPDASGWFSLNPETNIPSAQADLMNGDFEVSIQGRSPLITERFNAWIDLRTVYHARSR